jgi:YbbR domain-containing protein
MTIPGFIKRNWRLKVGCFLIAFVTWVGVVYAGNPPETRVVELPVPQSTTNIPAAFVLVRPVQNVPVRIGGAQNTLASFDPRVLMVTVDWAEVTHTGTYSIPISIVNTDSSIELIDPPTRIQVDLDAFVSVSVPVQIVVTNPPPVGYRQGAQEATPSTVAIDGPEHELVGVQARVTVDLSRQKANFQAEVQVLAYDSKGSRLNYVGVDHPFVSVSIAIEADLTSRSVAVVPGSVGNPSQGRYLVSLVFNPATVLLSGPQDLLNALVSVSTSAISLNGITGSYTETVTILPPAGVTASPPKVAVTIEVSLLPTPAPTPTPNPTPTPSPTPSPT